ncbi:MAG: Hpt domain-containing protein [Allosphingosinicella sp.]
MAALRARFVARSVVDLGLLRQALEERDWDATERICHRIAGIAGTVGFGSVSVAASELEEAVACGGGSGPIEALAKALIDLLESSSRDDE